MNTTPTAPTTPLEDASILMDLYFATESPAERDLVFEQLIANPSPVIDTFLQAMLEEDDDDHMRLSAACELAKRGKPEGIQYLEAQLDEPIHLGFFLRAIDVLCTVHGPSFYDRLYAIWQDPTRDHDERRQAMLALEEIDLTRALKDYAEFVTHFADDLQHIHEDQLQAAALSFAQHDYKDAIPLLQQLKIPIQNNTTLQDEEKLLLISLLDEAIRWQRA